MTGKVPPKSLPASGFSRLRNRLFHLWFVLRRPMTLGVRAVVCDEETGTVLLVRQTYVPGWHLPGGGVEPGETMEAALIRELAEEANIELLEPAQLVSLHWNSAMSRRDHIALFQVRAFRQSAIKKPDMEIAEARFFALDALPAGLSAGTARRMDEVFSQLPANGHW